MRWWAYSIAFVLLLCCCAKSSDEEVNMLDIRKPAVAGSWYPGDPESLKQMISEFMDSASIDVPAGRIAGLILPHAGYVYSGPVAAYGIKTLLQNKSEYMDNTIVLIGFAHRPTNWEGISIWAKGAWETPLGSIPVDEEMSAKIMSYAPDVIQYRQEVHSGEHSLEMELPFLQYALDSKFRIVPIAFSHQTGTELETLVGALMAAQIDWNKTIIVVSTDMSHYHPYDEAVSIDRQTLQYVLSGDIEGLVNWIRGGTDAFCGWAAVLTAMSVMPKIGAQKTMLLKYANSGDVQPASAARGVVGYCAVAYVMANGGNSSSDESPENKDIVKENDEYSLSKEQKLYLLDLARRTIEKYVSEEEVLELGKPDDPKLTENAPVFVTIHNHGRLRGCIGQMVAQQPLYLAVRDMAISAATRDRRFMPLSSDELQQVDLEISVLSPLRKIDSWEKIEQNRHGVYIRQDWKSGVFLPQVWEHFQNKEDFLAELCSQKAGLPRDCYKNPDTEISIYTVLEFNENDMGLK